MSDPMALHRLIRLISNWALSSFFEEVRVIGGEHVPKDGPIIVCVYAFFRTGTGHNFWDFTGQQRIII